MSMPTPMSTPYDALARTLVEEFDVDPALVRPEATFSGLELDSLSLAELAVMVQDSTGVRVEDIDRDSTLADVARRIGEGTAAVGGRVR
ncbi:acyl carrier protein [Streptomyces gamaensis]|uniref:Acyl carrier protein n=1 Tax=Streptomyces gamaensis TaxID=1763542 RepID=A0ABW0YZU6_9ACTN